MDITVPARVEQFGIDAYRAGIARFENPYVEFADVSRDGGVADAVGQILMDAWWRGWDKAAKANAEALEQQTPACTPIVMAGTASLDHRAGSGTEETKTR